MLWTYEKQSLLFFALDCAYLSHFLFAWYLGLIVRARLQAEQGFKDALKAIKFTESCFMTPFNAPSYIFPPGT